jgi:hypothetical protein
LRTAVKIFAHAWEKRECHNDTFEGYLLKKWNDGDLVGSGHMYCALAHPRVEVKFDEELGMTVSIL